jgi:pimeloyl-ACP methyl ester carboxylesterase
MPFCGCQGYRLHYHIRGHASSPPLLLIQGMAMPASAWITLPGRLARRFRVVLFDNRGAGRSTAPRGRFRIRDMADDAARVLDAAGVDQAFVFGISMGGMIAQELVLRHPQRVRALVLAATFCSHWRSHKPKLSVAADLALAILTTRRFKPMARLLVSEQYFANSPNGFVSWFAHTEPAGLRLITRQIAAVVRHEAESRLTGIHVPTLVLSGDRDRLVPVENSRRLAQLIPGARMVEFTGAGHAFPFEREEETVRLIIEHFLGPEG